MEVSFLSDWKSWIFLPTRLEIEVSDDGRSFRPAGSLENPPQLKEVSAFIKNMRIPVNTDARYVRVFAKNTGNCPQGHPGAGGKAWLFADEIEIK